jgi:hypothetical protein
MKNLKVREQGEPNQFVIHTENNKDWAAHIQFNGHFTLPKQREMIGKMVSAIETKD